LAIFLYILSMIAVIAMFPGEVCAETLIDTNFGSANRPVEIIDEQKDLRITGFLPEGWDDNSSWAKVHLDYQHKKEGDLEFLRIHTKKIIEGWCQLAYRPLPDIRQENYYTLSVKIRNLSRSPVLFGIRDVGQPYDFLWEEVQHFSRTWREYSFNFRIKPPEQPVGLWIVSAAEGMFDIASLKLVSQSRDEIMEDMKAKYEGVEFRNLLRVSRFPLGLQSGWSLSRDNSDGDDVLIDADPEVTGPSGAPALHIHSDELMRLYTAPFAVPAAHEPHVASLYIRGVGSGKVAVVCDGRQLANKGFDLKQEDGWQLIQLQFSPVLFARAYGIRLEGQGDVWIDAMQVKPGNEATAYKSQHPCEVALACTRGDAKAALVQFDDEPASVSFCVSGEAKDAKLKTRVFNLYGEEKPLPDVSLKREFLQYGEMRYDVFPDKPYGTFRIEAWVENSAGERISTYNEIVMHRLRRPHYWMKDGPDSHFGVHTNSTTRHIIMAKAIGINWVRLHDAGMEYLGWYHIEPQRGEWKFRDKEIHRYRRFGMKVLGELGTAPKWASYYQDVGKDHSGYFDCYYQPKDLEDYANYVRTVAQRYKGVIDAYDVWNEPWIHAWWAVSYDESKGGDRDGYVTSADPAGDFVKLMATAYKNAKDVDDSITILGVNSTTGTAGKNSFGGEEWTRGIVQHGGMDYCDAVCYHQYTGDPVGYPGDVVTRGFQTATGPIVEQFGRNPKPVWMTEGSAVVKILGSGFYNHTLPYQSSENIMHTSDRLCRFVVSLLAQGVEKVFLYSMHAHSYFPGGSNWRELVTDEGALHPSGAAHSALAWYLDDARFVKTLDIADGFHAYLFESSDRSVAVLSASHGDTEFTIPQQEDVYAADLFGNPIAPGAVAGDTLFYLWTPKDVETLENMLQTTEH
jgi:hypothetical protein